MIDTDIKADFDDVMTSQVGFSNVDSLDLLNNLDSIDAPFKFDSRYHEVDEVLNHPPQWSSQHLSAGQDVSALNSNYFDDSLSGTNVMVNPNSVMPCQLQFSSQAPPSSHTPSPVPPSPVPQHLTVNTGYSSTLHQSPSPSPMSPHTYPAIVDCFSGLLSVFKLEKDTSEMVINVLRVYVSIFINFFG